MPFKFLALPIGAIGALCPWFPPGSPSMRLAGVRGLRRRSAPGTVPSPAGWRFPWHQMRTVDLADDEQARVGLAADWHVCLNRAASAVPRSRESPGSGDNLSLVWRQAWDRTGSNDQKERRLRV